MDLIAMTQSVPQALNALLDDSTVSVLALLIGIVGGWKITGLHQQMKARKVKLSRKQPPLPRKTD
jgi:hypothetical protein